MGNDAEAKKTDSPRRLFRRWPFVFCLLLIQLVLLLNLNWMTSYNRTESGHIGAAVYFWKVRRFDIFCVNPPLARAICGAPIALCRPNYDWKSYSPRPQDRAEWGIGSAFIEANDVNDVRLYFFLARTALFRQTKKNAPT